MWLPRKATASADCPSKTGILLAGASLFTSPILPVISDSDNAQTLGSDLDGVKRQNGGIATKYQLLLKGETSV